jgi:anti-sigma B factor antagonist
MASGAYEKLTRSRFLSFDYVWKRESLMPDQPAPRRLILEIEQCNDNLTIVRCQGQLVSGLTDVLYTNVRPMIQANKRIVLDLSELTWMDSMGLGALVGLYTSAKAAGCELQLLKIGKRVRELLGLTHLLDVFSIIGEHGVRL